MSDYNKKSKLYFARRKTVLSATRTMLSFFRTAVVLLSLAFAFMKLDKENPIDAFTIVLFVLAGIAFVGGLLDFFITKSTVNSIDEE